MSSTVIAKNIQIGTSGTATNNFNWYQPAAPDGTVRLGVGNYGATTLDAVTVNNSGSVGIGTSSPNIGGANTDNAILTLKGKVASRGGIFEMGNFGTTGNDQTLGWNRYFDGSTENANIEVARASSTSTAYMKFSTNGGSGVTERMRIDASGNVGIGVTPSAWGSNFKVLQVGVSSYLSGRTDENAQVRLGSNAYYSGGFKYIATAAAAEYAQTNGAHAWYTAPSGTAGNAITFTQAMTLDASGNLGIGTSLPTQKLHVASSTAPYIALDGTGGTSARLWSIQNRPDVSGAFWIRDETAGATRVAIDSSGNFQFNSGYGSVATAYGCRAWVNFNGTGTVAIRASGNVSSITDNGVGQYTVNFTNGMPDANYSFQAMTVTNFGVDPAGQVCGGSNAGWIAAGSFRFFTYARDTGSIADYPTVTVAIFR